MKPDFTFTYVNGTDYQKIGDIQNLLSSDSYVLGWAEDAEQRQKRSDSIL